MPRIFTVILFIFCINCLSAQQKEVVRSIFWKGDTLPHVWLEEVNVRQKNKNAGWFQRQHRRQTRLEYNVRKVYPYARIAAGKFKEIEQKLSAVTREPERKKDHQGRIQPADENVQGPPDETQHYPGTDFDPINLPGNQPHFFRAHPGIPGDGKCLLLAIDRFNLRK